MDLRVGLVILLVFASYWVSDARNFAASEESGVEAAGKKANLCPICEQYVAVALDYLTDENTQNEVVDALHDTCSRMQSLEDQCKTLVDEFAKTFFSQVSAMQPEGFCKKLGVCKHAMASPLPAKGNKCDVCKLAVDEVLDVLKDPDTELDIIERLLRACNAVGDKFRSKCKKTVFEFGPAFLEDAGGFVEKLDICTTFHACTKHLALPEKMIEMVTSS